MQAISTKHFCAWALAALAGLTSCSRESATPGPVRSLSARESATVTTTNDFAFRLFRQVSREEAGRNAFISPFSVATALMMAYNGAETTTKAEIRNTLGLAGATDDEINESYQSLYLLLNGIDRTVTFTSANAVWYRTPLQARPAFVETTRKYFGAQVEGLDFDSPDAPNMMNAWVHAQTNGKITRMVDELPPDHVMYLMNALYFKGTWTYQFDKKLTSDGFFRLADGRSVKHPFMQLAGGGYLLHQDGTHTLVDLPYGNKQFSMTLLMPGPAAGVDVLMEDLSPDRLNEWLAAARPSDMPLFMPKFKLEYEKTLNETLARLGMSEAFTWQADLSGLLQGFGPGQLKIDEVKHKTYVEVDEEGTEAAAVTSISVVTRSAPPSVQLDRPFVFLVREKATGAILLMGKLMQPEL